MEVLHGDIRITLTDEEAIRGMRRTQAAIKRGLAQIEREKAVVKVEADLKGMERDLTRARQELKKLEGLQADVKLGLRDGDFEKDIEKAKLNVKSIEGMKAEVEIEVRGEREALAKMHALQQSREQDLKLQQQGIDTTEKAIKAQRRADEAEQRSIQTSGRMHAQAIKMDDDRTKRAEDNVQRYGRMQAQAIKMDDDRTKRIEENIQKEGHLRARAENEMERDLNSRESKERAMLRAQQEAIDMDRKRTISIVSHTQEVAKLRQEYNKASAALQRMNQQGVGKRLGRIASPDAKQEFDINQSRVIGEMEVLRAKLAAMGEKPIDIHVNVKQSRVMEKLFGIGDIGTRLGPFSGTLKQFSVAALALGPILVGLLGTVTALAGAIGAGLTGGLGVAGAAATAFGLSLGGVGFATVSLFRDFKNLNTMQAAYHKQVLKTGANSDKAKEKLKEFNHALGTVSPSARAAFSSFDQLQTHWRNMTKALRPQFLEALGSTFRTLNNDFGLFSRGTRKAFTEVTNGWEGWMKGLRGAEAQNIIFTLMDNANRALKPFMEGLGHLGAAWGRVAMSFSRYLPAIMTGFDNWAGGLDHASQNVDHLNSGVDGLMGSLKSTGSVLTAFGRVIIEMSKAAMGPGGGMLDGIASGLNGIADSIARDPSGLHDFFAESIQTVEALYGVLQPLAALFIEFSTIMRPATTAILTVLGPIADFTKWLASLSGIHAALQAWGTLWLFKKGTALIVGGLAGSVNVLAAALARLGKEQAALKLEGLVAATTRTGAATTAATAAAARAAVPVRAPREPTGTSKLPTVVTTGGATRPLAAGEGAAREAATVGKMAKFGGALSAVTTGLLGVSAPVAGLGLAAVGAGFAIKGMIDASKARAAQEKRITDHFGKDAVPVERKPVGVGRLGAFGATPQQHAAMSRGVDTAKQRAELDKLATSYDAVNNAIFQSGQRQRDLISTGSQLQNSHLMLEQAEKSYADAVKNSGKHSLEARMALQQLRDARTQDTQATQAWADQSRDAMNWMNRAVARAQAAFEASRGTGAENEMSKKLDAAKNSAAALEVNLRRAKKGMDIFTGEGAQKIGAFLRQYGDIPGVKHILLQVETQRSAEKIAKVIGALEDVGKRKTVTRILADAKNPTEALRLLNAALDKWEKRHPVAQLRADKSDVQKKLSDANNALSHYGSRKPQALLQARDDAQKKLDRLNKQLDHLNGKKADVGVDINFHLPKDFQSAASVSRNATSGDSHGDGWGVPNIAGAVKGFTMKQGGKLSSMMMGAGGLGGFPASGSGLNAFNGIAQRFGLTIGSGLRPGAITSSGNTSYHSMGRARDFPGDPAHMMAFAKFMARMYGSRLKELIYTPLGWSIKNGQKVPPYAQKEHYNHVHVAMAQGGERPRSGKYTQPTVLFAEEPNRPEYFISTNPRDKKRSQALITQAAADVGMIEHSALFNAAHPVKKFKTGGVTGKGLGAVGKFDKEQQRIIQTALAIAKSLGAPTKATKALIAALLDESGARNLKYGSGSSTGPLQLLSSTAKSFGVNPRDTKAVIKLFLTKGFTGKGGAIKLAGNKHLTAADVAAKVQGNKNGASDYARFMGKASAILSATNFKGGSGGGTDTSGPPAEVPTLGPSSNLAIQLANAQGRLDFAGTTATNYQDDINAIYGYDTRVPSRRNRNQGQGRIPTGKARRGAPAGGQRGNTVGVVGGMRGGLPPAPRPKFVHHEGMIDVLNQQDDASRRRLGTINDKLKGRLTRSKRTDLLSEKEQIRSSLTGNRVKKKELRTQADEAVFEKQQGRNSKIRNDYRTAKAGSTATLTDDIEAAKAEAQYYQNRENFARSRGDIAGAADARNSFNSANQNIKQYEDQIAQSGLSYRAGLAQATKGLDDDIAVAKDSLAYWTAKRDMALAAGDIVGAADAQQQINSATDQIKSFTDQIKEEQHRFQEGMIGYFEGQAKLTGTLTDDLSTATSALTYWQARLKEAQLSGDTEGAFAAASQVQNYTTTVQGLQEDMKRLPMERDLAIAQMTTSMTDDAAALANLRDYWQARLAQAQKDNDLQGQIEASGNIQNYTDNLAKLQEDMKRLPLERDKAFAALTDDTEDDKKATVALRDYWAQRLEEVKASGDIQGQIEAAGNLQSLNSEIKDAEQNVATQMVLLAEARRDLYSTFGSNFIPTIPKAAMSISPTPAAASGGTVVNLTVNGADLAQDPHTWSQGVAWEIQAAV